MSSKESLQCPHCLQWITISHGGFNKHIRSCQTTSIHGNNSCTDRKAPIWNPLLSCSIDTERDNNVQSSEDNSENPFDFQSDCEDLFHEGDDDYDNTLDYQTDGEDLHHEGDRTISAAQCLPIFKQRSNASVHKFQVMLLDIIYKHKASLKMYDDICELVNEYSSSSDFDRHAKL